jgi:hypothetical protein
MKKREFLTLKNIPFYNKTQYYCLLLTGIPVVSTSGRTMFNFIGRTVAVSVVTALISVFLIIAFCLVPFFTAVFCVLGTACAFDVWAAAKPLIAKRSAADRIHFFMALNLYERKSLQSRHKKQA